MKYLRPLRPRAIKVNNTMVAKALAFEVGRKLGLDLYGTFDIAGYEIPFCERLENAVVFDSEFQMLSEFEADVLKELRDEATALLGPDVYPQELSTWGLSGRAYLKDLYFAGSEVPTPEQRTVMVNDIEKCYSDVLDRMLAPLTKQSQWAKLHVPEIYKTLKDTWKVVESSFPENTKSKAFMDSFLNVAVDALFDAKTDGELGFVLCERINGVAVASLGLRSNNSKILILEPNSTYELPFNGMTMPFFKVTLSGLKHGTNRQQASGLSRFIDDQS